MESCFIVPRNEQSPTCEVVHKTKERLPQTSPTDSLLAQLAEHGTDDLEVCEFKPHWGQILTKFILCCVTLDLSDNLTEMHQIVLL